MRIARHWVRETAVAVDKQGREHRAAAWGWSAEAPQEAAAGALASAERVAKWLAGGAQLSTPKRSWEYQYSADRPQREEIVHEFHDVDDQVAAYISRNLYGALVLNTRDLMFIDIDLEPPPSGPVAWLSKWLSGTAAQKGDEQAVFDRIRNWSRSHPQYEARVYRTAAGYRVALVGALMRPESEETMEILEQLGSDRLYRRLCQSQQCFRARLTPKPWRIGISRPAVRFPYKDQAQEKRARDWQAKYDLKSKRFAVCELVEAPRGGAIHADLEPLLELHDSLTGVGKNLPLA
jgi:hypothetical protein